MLHTGKDHPLLILAELLKRISAGCVLWCPVLTCHQLRLWVPFLLLLPPPPRLIAAASVIEHEGLSGPLLCKTAYFLLLPSQVCPALMQSESALLWTPTFAPHVRYKHLLFDLISFGQFNKKGFCSTLSRYGQHDRLIPQMMLVPFQGVEIIVRTTSLVCLRGDGSKDKKKCVVSGEGMHYNIYFLRM